MSEEFEEIGGRKVRVIHIDLDALYDIGGPEEAPSKILMEILKYYNLIDRTLVVLDCPFDRPLGVGCFVMMDKLGLGVEEVLDYDVIAEKLPKDQDIVLVRLMDGYDTAEAIVKISE